jgi:hypothetical protein
MTFHLTTFYCKVHILHKNHLLSRITVQYISLVHRICHHFDLWCKSRNRDMFHPDYVFE